MTTRTRNADRAPRQHVHVHSDPETRYWASRLGCTAAELRAAVFAVGTPLDEVREHLLRRRAAKTHSLPADSERRGASH